MTMILALGNRDQVIQLSDRRLTSQGTVVDEEAGKSGVMVLPNARLAFGFTGIAQIVRLEMRRWILDALYESAPPDYMVRNTLERFKKRATDLFRSNHLLRCLPAVDKRLTVMFTGYLHMHDPPMIGNAIISNYQNSASNVSSSFARDEFTSSYTNEKKPREDNLTFVQRVGAWPAMIAQDVDSLRVMLVARKPRKAITEKATDVMLHMADRPGAADTIGKQITWIVIPSDLSQGAESGYYSNIPSHTVFMASSVFLLGDGRRQIYDVPSISAVDPSTTPPMAVPKVRRNAPCPCGSGKKYKRCHGR